MRSSLLRSWLLASAGAAALAAGPAWAQQDSECARQLDRTQEELQQSDVAADRRADVQLVIDGARTLAETGDEEGCERVSAELDQLMQVVTGTDAQAAAQQQRTPAEEIAGAGDVSTPDHQVRQSINEAQMALQQDDVETARSALEEARQNLPQVSEQAGDDAQQQLDQVDQSIQQALDALEQDDVRAAQQALEEAKAPMQQAMLQPGDQTPESGQADQPSADQQPASTVQPETPVAAGSEQQPGGATVGDSPLAQMPASELLGQTVVNDQGDTVAELTDMVKRPDSDEIYALLSVGGFLGLGQKEVAMPLDRFEIGPDQQIVLSNVTEEELTNMPDWQDDGAFQSVGQ